MRHAYMAKTAVWLFVSHNLDAREHSAMTYMSDYVCHQTTRDDICPVPERQQSSSDPETTYDLPHSTTTPPVDTLLIICFITIISHS